MASEPAIAGVIHRGNRLLSAPVRATPQRCLRVVDRYNQVFTEMRPLAEEGTNHMNSFLRKNGYPVNPPNGATFTLNVIFHVFVLFIALTVLYITVIAPLESKTLQKEVDEKLQASIREAFQNADPDTRKKLHEGLAFARPQLERLSKRYDGEDPCRVAHNKSVFASAWGIVMVLGLVWVVTIAVLAASGVSMGKPVAHIVFENLIIFAIVGGVEFAFFKLVASKFVPVMPSQLAKDSVAALQSSFPSESCVNE